MARTRRMVEAPELVARWAEGWAKGPCPAVGSVLDVLTGDLLEEERGTRPDDAVVEIPVSGPPRIDAEAYTSWTFGWPTPPGPVAQAAWATGLWPVKWVDRRLRTLLVEVDARQAGFVSVRGELGDIDWPRLAPMEVVSLALGHFGPTRQEKAIAVAEGALVSRAVAFAAGWYYPKVSGMARDRIHAIYELAENAARVYREPFQSLAEVSSAAVQELARRAATAGLHVQDPWSLPVRRWVDLLGERPLGGF